jgi:hypothetical protein
MRVAGKPEMLLAWRVACVALGVFIGYHISACSGQSVSAAQVPTSTTVKGEVKVTLSVLINANCRKSLYKFKIFLFSAFSQLWKRCYCACHVHLSVRPAVRDFTFSSTRKCALCHSLQ